MLRRIVLGVALCASSLSPSLATAEDDARRPEFPYTLAENGDGSRFVWVIYSRAGYPFPYTSAGNLPLSPAFRTVPDNLPQAGDVAWWPGFVAIAGAVERDAQSRRLPPPVFTADGPRSLAELEAKWGKVRWYRFVDSEQASSVK